MVPYSNEFETESMTMVARHFGGERIRKGSILLFKDLQNRGHELGMYTSSLRSEFFIRKTFL